jgi:1-acyl-sn-glycerol-3-phosphate acyltransferase
MRATALKSFRLAVYLGFTAPMMGVQGALLLAKSPWRASFPRWYHRVCCRILGFRLEIRGEISQRHPTLFIVNHTSYTDITILGAVLDASFVAKTEVASWPFFGWLAKLQRTVFVDRRARNGAAQQRDALATRLEAGDNLILFPEGTSNDGLRVLPFKSALFSVAEYKAHGEPLAVQPVSLTYAKLDGMPIGRALRPFVAWYGGMDLAPHLWELLGLGVITAVIEFHPVVTIAELGSRKRLAEHCRRAVMAGVVAALTGRDPEPSLLIAKAA